MDNSDNDDSQSKKTVLGGKICDFQKGEKKFVNFNEHKENENSSNKQFFKRGGCSPHITDPTNMILDEESEPSMS